ncbi:hypothetical protein RDI58_024899 [Solanum bulbocastanum]|uniref:GH10 domain-containing protein n=1 Tax=Solanum bulbocastanum TaxID=147425 RepID=A0AAN8Y430_SOLBU
MENNVISGMVGQAIQSNSDLKWYKTEPLPGVFNYTIVDQMMQLKKLLVRGHTMFWGNPTMIQYWVENMTVQSSPPVSHIVENCDPRINVDMYIEKFIKAGLKWLALDYKVILAR